MARTHARWWVLIGLGVIAVVGLGPAGVAGASCSGPRLTISSGVVAPGANVAVAGAGFGTDCNDTGGAGPPLGSPARHIEVAFVEGLDRRVLGFARADDDYSLTLWVTVPIDAVPGAASLDVGGSTASIWIDGAPVASPTPTPSVQQARGYRAPTKVSRTGQFVMVGLLGAVAGAGLVVVARKVRDRGDMRGVDRATG